MTCAALQDCLVYLLNREQHTVGQETPSARPNICLFSPDILPLHCRLRRVPAPRRHANGSSSSKAEEPAESQRFCVAVEPVLHATVLVNFSRCERSTTLRHGDLLSFGAHYIFLYKDPTGAKPLPAQTLARLRTLGQLYDAGAEEADGGAQTCKVCGSVLKDRAAQESSVPAARRSFKPHLVKPRGRGAASHNLSAGGGGGGARGAAGAGQKRRLQLEFDQSHEDQLLNRIMSLIEPGGVTIYSRDCVCACHACCNLLETRTELLIPCFPLRRRPQADASLPAVSLHPTLGLLLPTRELREAAAEDRAANPERRMGRCLLSAENELT